MVPVTDAPPPLPPPPRGCWPFEFFLNLALLVLHKLSAVKEMPEVYALGKFTYDDTLVSYPGGSSPMMIHWCHIQGEVHL